MLRLLPQNVVSFQYSGARAALDELGVTPDQVVETHAVHFLYRQIADTYAATGNDIRRKAIEETVGFVRHRLDLYRKYKDVLPVADPDAVALALICNEYLINLSLPLQLQIDGLELDRRRFNRRLIKAADKIFEDMAALDRSCTSKNAQDASPDAVILTALNVMHDLNEEQQRLAAAGPGDLDPQLLAEDAKLYDRDFKNILNLPGLGDELGKVSVRMAQKLKDRIGQIYKDYPVTCNLDRRGDLYEEHANKKIGDACLAVLRRLWISHEMLENSMDEVAAARVVARLDESEAVLKKISEHREFLGEYCDYDATVMAVLCHDLFDPDGDAESLECFNDIKAAFEDSIVRRASAIYDEAETLLGEGFDEKAPPRNEGKFCACFYAMRSLREHNAVIKSLAPETLARYCERTLPLFATLATEQSSLQQELARRIDEFRTAASALITSAIIKPFNASTGLRPALIEEQPPSANKVISVVFGPGPHNRLTPS